MSDKLTTFTVVTAAGEKVNGINVRPYEHFQAEMTPDLKEKVKKGFLAIGKLTPEDINNPSVKPSQPAKKKAK